MESSGTLREYVESKVARLPRYYDDVSSVEAILDFEAGRPSVEIIAHVDHRKAPFVASHCDDDMYASIDLCMDKISQQLRRHKDKVRDRKGAETG
jgi:putative sigma-54 modulation protein